ncbi:MAG: hypothetical protein U0736_13575 [Gemmataceae bacterium]
MLGLWPLPERTPLQATVTGTVDRGPVVVEKLHYQSKPGLYVTGNLYRPKDSKKRLPAIFYVCGHSGRGRDGNKTAFQDHGMWFARNGYVCLIVDTLQLGEIAGKHHGTYNLNRWWWHSARLHPCRRRVLERRSRHRLPRLAAGRRPRADRRHRHLWRRRGDDLDCRCR